MNDVIGTEFDINICRGDKRISDYIRKELNSNKWYPFEKDYLINYENAMQERYIGNDFVFFKRIMKKLKPLEEQEVSILITGTKTETLRIMKNEYEKIKKAIMNSRYNRKYNQKRLTDYIDMKLRAFN